MAKGSKNSFLISLGNEISGEILNKNKAKK
jgi:hypothetical protein